MSKAITKKAKSPILWLIAGAVFCLALLLSSLLFFQLEANRLIARIPSVPYASELSQESIQDYIQISEKITADPNSPEDWLELGMRYHAGYFYDQAETCYETVTQINPDGWESFYYLGLIMEELGDSQASIENLSKATQLNPLIAQAWLKLGGQYLKLNHYQHAKDAYNKSLDLNLFYPKNYSSEILPNKGTFPIQAHVLLGLARVELQTDQAESAESLLSQLVKKFPTFGPAYRLLSQVYYQSQRPQKGDEFTIRAGDYEPFSAPADPLFDVLALYSKSPSFLLKQIELGLRTQNYGWAKILSEYMLKHQLERGEAYSHLIHVALETYQYTNLESLLTEHYTIFGNSEHQLIAMGQYLARKDQVNYAIRYFSKAIWLNEESTKARIEFVKVLMRIRNFDKAREQAYGILALDQSNEFAHNQLGKILYLEGNPLAATKQFNHVIALNMDNELALLWLGILAEDANQPSTAIRYYAQSVEANTSNENTWLKLGNYHLALKQWESALKHFQKALKFSPNSIDFLERYSWILATCPDEQFRDGTQALEIAKRLATRLKIRANQNITCGISLAAAYAETGDFFKAERITVDLIDYARQTRVSGYANLLSQLLESFQAGRPFRI